MAPRASSPGLCSRVLLWAALGSPAGAQCLVQSFYADGPQPPTVQGNFVGFGGDVAVASCFLDADPAGSGVLVWRRTAGAWVFEDTLISTPLPEPNAPDRPSADGDTIAVIRGAKLYVYKHDAAGWQLQAQPTFPQASIDGQPEVDGDRIAVRLMVNGIHPAVGVLRRVGGTWQIEGTVYPDPDTFAGFSGAISMSGDELAVGASVDLVGGVALGAAYVFRYDGATWSQEAKLLGPAGGLFFGRGVGIDGDDLVVGATGNASVPGHVHFFHHEAGEWQPVLTWTDTSGGADPGSDVGWDVDVQNGLAVAGIHGFDGSAPNSGAVAAFRRRPAGWEFVAMLEDPAGAQSANLGFSLAVDGETIVTAAWGAAGSVPTQGRKYAFGGVPGSAAFTDLQGALAGAGAAPCLVGDGTPAAGEPVHFIVAHAPPGAPAWVLAGSQLLGQPFKGGTLVPQPELVLPGFAAGDAGIFELAGPWPPWVPPGAQVLLQAWIVDADAPHGFSASNGLQVVSF